MAHAQGVRIWFCELTPWKGYTRNLFGRGDDIQWSPEYDALRLELNAWFQSADCPADGYIPLDALADPTTRTRSSPPIRPTACTTRRPGSGRSPR